MLAWARFVRDWRGGETWMDVDAGLGEMELETRKCREMARQHNLTALKKHLLQATFILGELLLVLLEMTRPD